MKIGVIMGGLSSERAISLKTGKVMLNVLKNCGYDVLEIIINNKEDIFNLPKMDFAMIALHGKYGEDGSVQSLLEMRDIPYSGCGFLASALCMDKNLTKIILKSNGIPTANWVTVKSTNEYDLKKAYDLEYPVFVKPNSGGSSVATFKVNDKDGILDAVTEALKWDNEVMIEEFIPGDELTCPMLDGELLPIVKIDSKGEFFDITSKYSSGGADEYVVDLGEKLHKKIKDICEKIWNSLGCEVYSRIDIILKGDDINVLEINTLPGMTETSLFPKSAKAYGMTMGELLDSIVKISMEKRKEAYDKKKSFIDMEKQRGLSSI